MIYAWFGARLALALLFAVAGVAKLLDLPASRQAIRDFRLPDILSGPLGVCLPVLELVLGGALLYEPTTRPAAAMAAALLVIFAAVIGWHLLHGRAPACHCFGQLSVSPVSSWIVARNGGFAAVSVWVSVSPVEAFGDSYAAMTSHLSDLTAFAALLLCLGGGVWFLMHLLKQQGRLLLRIEVLEARLGDSGSIQHPIVQPQHIGLPVGAPAPSFSLRTLANGLATLQDLLRRQQPLLLIFVDPACGPCDALLPEVADWYAMASGRWQPILVTRNEAGLDRKLARFEADMVLLDSDRELARAYYCAGTPSGVLVRADGSIGSGVAAGADAIRNLIGLMPFSPAPSHSNTGRPQPGDEAPLFTLPDLHGVPVSLRAFLGQSVLLVFWNPACGFCMEMAGYLHRWENLVHADPQLLLVAAGSREQNLELGFLSPVLLDPEFQTAGLFGAAGTPTAVLISPDGRIASPLLVGKDAIRQLLPLEAEAMEVAGE